jgi:hypothetical protein
MWVMPFALLADHRLGAVIVAFIATARQALPAFLLGGFYFPPPESGAAEWVMEREWWLGLALWATFAMWSLTLVIKTWFHATGEESTEGFRSQPAAGLPAAP